MVASFNFTISLPEQIAVIQSFSYLGFLGEVDLNTPDLEVGVFEEYAVHNFVNRTDRLEGTRIENIALLVMGRKVSRLPLWSPHSLDGSRALSRTKELTFLCKQICDSQRNLMDVFSLKKRAYIGTTSMEAEVSLLMANQALAAPGKLCYDPFG